jgi:KUP system potassium uptake protein
MTAMLAAASKPSGTLPIAATLGALGVVYGDIGTSPLYALKEAAKAAAHGGQLTPEAILGVVSLILWALILIISLKYALLICALTTAAKAALSLCWPCCLPVMRSPEPGAPNC